MHPVKCNPETEFDCGNNHCISLKLVCNNKNDCGEFEDEPKDLCCKYTYSFAYFSWHSYVVLLRIESLLRRQMIYLILILFSLVVSF